MKRKSCDIINDMVESKKLVLNYHKKIIEEENYYDNYSIELDNFYIDDYKESIIKQFENSDTIILDWQVGCFLNENNKRIYYNKVLLMVNYELFFDFSVDCTNYYPNNGKFVIYNIKHNKEINLMKIKNKDELNDIINENILFDLYNIFMFDPKNPEYVYKPNESNYFCKNISGSNKSNYFLEKTYN